MDVFRLALLNRTLNRIYCSLDVEDGKSARGLETMQRLTNFLVSFQNNEKNMMDRCYINLVVLAMINMTFCNRSASLHRPSAC